MHCRGARWRSFPQRLIGPPSCQAPAQRKASSDYRYEQLERPSRIPIVLACQEVQIRYWLDQRFIVRSLDGRIDPVLFNYYHDGYIDHIGYIKERHIAYLFDLANYTKDPDQWSLKNLAFLNPGEVYLYQGLVFKRLNDRLFQVLHDKTSNGQQ